MDEIRNHRFIRQNFTREKWVSRFINCEFIFCTFDNSDFSESVFIAVSGYGNIRTICQRATNLVRMEFFTVQTT